MQLTRIDRWLLERFIYETHIHTLSDPGEVPRRIRRIQGMDLPGMRFQHHFSTRSEKAAETFIARLKATNQMFTVRIVNRRAWYAAIIAPGGKSFSWRCVWIVLGASLVFAGGTVVRDLWRDPEIRRHVADAIEVLKG